MKRAYGFLVLLLFITACTTMGPMNGRDLAIVKIIDTGKGKQEAFDLSMRWVALSFKSAKSVIEYSDKNVGTINAKGTMSVPGGFGVPVNVNFSLVIDLKDTQARMILSAISVYVPGGTLGDQDIYPPVFDKFKIATDELVDNYTKYIKNTTTNW